MVRVTINGTTEEYLDGIKYLDIAEQHQKEYDQDIVLVRINGKLKELFKNAADGVVEFVTTKEKVGMDTYRRSAIHMMLKALYDVAGPDMIQQVRIHFSISNAIYCEMHGIKVEQQLLEKFSLKRMLRNCRGKTAN